MVVSQPTGFGLNVLLLSVNILLQRDIRVRLNPPFDTSAVLKQFEPCGFISASCYSLIKR